MKNFIKSSLCFAIFALFFTVGIFALPKSVAFASEKPKNTPVTPILEGVCITQDGYEFGLEDFEVVKNNDLVTYYLYVNTAITISRTNDTYALVVSEQNQSGYTYKTTTINNSKTYHCVEYSDDKESIIKVRLEFINMASVPNVTVSSMEFYIVQTPNHFKVNPTYSWTDFAGTPITAPTTAGKYNDFITLNNLTGSAICPVYVDFYFNGEFYSIYTDNAEGRFYNTLTGNQIVTDSLKFDIAGQYEIFIYDKTAYRMLKTVNLWKKDYKVFDKLNSGGSPYANAQSYTFNIATVVRVSDYDGPNDPAYLKALADNIYIVAQDDRDTTIVSTQTVNRTVNVKFYNLDSRVVGSIIIKKFHLTIEGFNEPSEEILTDKYTISQINHPDFKYTASDDNSYAIYIYDRNGLQIGEHNADEDSNFSFTILKDIHSYYKLLDNKNPELVPDNNKIYKIQQTEMLDTSFESFKEITSEGEVSLQSSTTTHYIVNLARASTSIDGINTGANINTTANLVVHGVGNITVTVTRDGSTTTYTLTDGASIPGTSEVGSYTIKIVDQMGFSATKSFKISRPINTATIVLIVVGIIVVILAVFLIIKLRTKIKVR